MRYDKKSRIEIDENDIFEKSREKKSSKTENHDFLKFHFFEKSEIFERKKVIEKKVTFSIFSIFHCLRKYFFHRKNNHFRKKIFSIFLSYLMPKPCKWRRATRSVPPVGAPTASLKIRKIMFFDDFVIIFQPKM